MIPLAGPIEWPTPGEVALLLLVLTLPAGVPGAIWGAVTRRPRVLWLLLGYVIFLVGAIAVRVALGAFAHLVRQYWIDTVATRIYIIGPTVTAVVLIMRWHARRRSGAALRTQ